MRGGPSPPSTGRFMRRACASSPAIIRRTAKRPGVSRFFRANRVIFFVSEAESGLFAAREAGIAHILGDAIPFRRVTLSLTGRTEAIRRAAKEFGADGNTAVVLNSGSLLEPALRVFPPRENLLLFADNAEPLRYGISLIVQPVAEIGRIAGKIAGAGETALSGTLVRGKLLTAEGVRA